MNEELAKKKQARADEYAFYRQLFRQCANEVARKQRAYDKGIKSRFRSMAALSRGMGTDASKWSKEKIQDARWSSIAAASNVSAGPKPTGAAAALAAGKDGAGGGEDAARQGRRRQRRIRGLDEQAVEELQPRDMVELYGISSEVRQHLNGCRGEVKEAKGEDGRCLVVITLPDGSQAEKRLRASQIRRVAPLVVGDTAEVFGLPPPNLLNGAHGTVQGYDPKQQVFSLRMDGTKDADGVLATVVRRFSPENLRRVASLKVGDQVEVFGLTGTSRALNGRTMFVHRWDAIESKFACALITLEQLQAAREARRARMEERRSATKVLISHDPISGMTSYDTTGDGQADAYLLQGTHV